MPASPLGENPLLFIIFIVSFMIITCLDLEGVLVPEVWIAVAKTTGIEGLALTTRDIPNYDELMRHRLGIIAQHGLTLAQVQEVIAQLEPMPGALDFLDWLRSTTQVVILSDTFEEFAQPLMKKLKMPCILCHQLVLDAKGNTISDQKSKNSFTGQQYGFQFDLTDDRVDPRRGTRFGQKSKPMESDTAFTSDLLVTDQEINFYIPMDHVDTLVVNAFRSRSSITRAGVTDEASARAALSQGCVKGAAGYAACKAAEDKIVNDALAYNRYGATSLGGSDRLRGYDMGRFTAGNADFYGVEYRWNFADEAKPVNWYVIGGVNTLVQLAIFAETGSVADKTADLSNQYKSDVGVGIRAIISGFVYRLDLAMGDEGLGVTMFIDYPMQLLPVME